MTSITGILTPLRLRRLFCSHHQTVHASAGTRCVSCGQRV
jgi:ribosomal protein S27E